MRAFINGKVVEIADFRPRADRTLIRVDTSYCERDKTSAANRISTYAKLAKKRLYQVPEVLFYDGIRHLFSKTGQLIRRESLALERQVASFTGVSYSNNRDFVNGNDSVFGITANHPANTELVLARPEFVLDTPEGVDPRLLALAWPGMTAIAVAKRVQESGVNHIQVIGSSSNFPVLDWILASVFGRANVVWRHPKRSSDWRIVAPAHVLTIATTLPPTQQRAFRGMLISFGPAARDVWRLLPSADVYAIVDYTSFLSDRYGPYLVDLFYDDGVEHYPSWLSPSNLVGYRDFLLERKTDSSPESLTISDYWNLGLGVHMESTNSPVAWIRFPGRRDAEYKSTSVVRVSGSSIKEKGGISVSLIGGGRWPLGMIVRQMAADRRIRLRGVCDRRPDTAYLASRALPFEYHTTDFSSILEDVETDVVVVAPYHGFHAEAASEALRHGKYCFLEKPPVINQLQLKRLIDAAEGRDALYVGYNRRFAPLTNFALEHLDTEPGPLFMNFVMRSLDLPPNHWYYWPSNGSRIIANCCHMIDLACQFAGQATPVSVVAVPANPDQIDRDVVITILFDDNSLANISYISRGRVRHGYFQKYLIARGGMFCEIDGYRKLKVSREGRTVARKRTLRDMGHRRQVREFLDSVINKGRSPVDLSTIAVSARTVLAADYSARHGGIPVQVDQDISKDPSP